MVTKIQARKIYTCKVAVAVTDKDICDGKACDPLHCMHKVAITRAIAKQFNLPEDEYRKLHVKVANTGIRFNLNGYRWSAIMPNRAMNNLILFDDQEKRHLVKPHSYTITATRGSKVIPFTRERQEQINAARRERARAGRPDKTYTAPTIRQRIVGNVIDNRGQHTAPEVSP